MARNVRSVRFVEDLILQQLLKFCVVTLLKSGVVLVRYAKLMICSKFIEVAAML